MAELSRAEYSSPDIFDLERWVSLKDGTLYLFDPATGKPLNSDRPPVWLASDERLAEGYQALGDPAHHHDLTIGLARHRLATDLGRFENGYSWFERTYAKSDAVAFEEASGWDPKAWQEVLRDLRSRPEWPAGLAQSPTSDSRMLRAALRYPNVPDFSYDIAKTDRPIDKLLLEMNSPEYRNSRLAEFDYPIRKTLHFAAIALREWYMPGKYMHELLKLDLPDSPRTLFTVGAAHGDIPRKFDVLGMTPKVRRFKLSKENREQADIVTDAMRQGRINFQALGKLSLGNE